jgi:hypothetical protein
MVETLRELHELGHQQKTEKLMVVVMFFEKKTTNSINILDILYLQRFSAI